MSVSQGDGRFADRKNVIEALQHGLRVLILRDLVLDGPTSPSRFHRTHGVSAKLSLVDYHFKKLVELGAVTLKERIRKRGLWEHIYQLHPDFPPGAISLLVPMNGAAANLKTNQLNLMDLTVDTYGVHEIIGAMREFRARLKRAEDASQKRRGPLQQVQVIYTDLAARADS